jgi:hypothetical protein
MTGKRIAAAIVTITAAWGLVAAAAPAQAADRAGQHTAIGGATQVVAAQGIPVGRVTLTSSVRENAPAAVWHLYSVLTSPQSCEFFGWQGMAEDLWTDFVCVGVNLTPIGPGLDYLYVYY